MNVSVMSGGGWPPSVRRVLRLAASGLLAVLIWCFPDLAETAYMMGQASAIEMTVEIWLTEIDALTADLSTGWDTPAVLGLATVLSVIDDCLVRARQEGRR